LEVFLSLEATETWLEYVCHSEGKTKYLSAFERDMVVGDRCTGLSVSTGTLLGFPSSTDSRVSRMVHHSKDIQPS
jgi:hypothetical protein